MVNVKDIMKEIYISCLDEKDCEITEDEIKDIIRNYLIVKSNKVTRWIRYNNMCFINDDEFMKVLAYDMKIHDKKTYIIDFQI